MREFLEAIGLIAPRERYYFYVKRGGRGRWRWFVCRSKDGTRLVAMCAPHGYGDREAAETALFRLVHNNIDLRATRIPDSAGEEGG